MKIRSTPLALLCLLSASMSGPVGAQAAAALAVPSFDDFLQPQAVLELRLSPNGEHLAYANRLENDRYVLQVLRLKDKVVVGSFGFKGDNDIGDIYWVNDTRLIFGVARKRALTEVPEYSNELHSIDLDGKNHKSMLGGYVNGLGYKSASNAFARGWDLVTTDSGIENEILIADYSANTLGEIEYRRYFRLDVVKGRTLEIGEAPGRYGSGTADSKGAIRLASGREKNGDTVDYYRDKAPGAWTEIGRLKLGEPGRDIRGFTPDETKVYAYERAADGLDKLVRFDPKTGSSELIFAEPGKSLGDLRLDADKRSLLFVETDQFSGKRHWFTDLNPRAEGIQQTLESNPNQRLEIVNFSRNGDRAVLRSYSSSNPGSYYVVDFTTGQVLMSHTLSPGLKGKATAEQKSVQIKARDGLMLPSVLTKALGVPAGAKPPMVVFVHGGPHGSCDLPGYDAEAQMLATRGYSVLQVNYRGSGCFGEDFQKKGYRQWGAAMQDDLTDATRWAIAEGQADPQRICIYGGSYGGYAALMGVTREPDLYRCAVGDAGVYDLRLISEGGNEYYMGKSGKSFYEKVIGTDRAELAARSPVSYADKIKVPVLLAHGEVDEIAPLAHYNAMAAAMKAANKPFSSFVRESEGHGFYSVKNRREYWRALVNFFDQNIGPASPAAKAAPAR